MKGNAQYKHDGTISCELHVWPQNSYVETPTPNVTIVADRTFMEVIR